MDSFLKQHKTLETKNATHLSLVGGKYHIPHDEMDNFYSLYVSNKIPMFLVERVRYPCYLFMDLDNTTVSSVVPFLNVHQCFISGREERTGFHIIFKSIIVNDCDEAIQKARSMIQDEYLDVSVYKTGLRMLGSYKSIQLSRIYKPYPFTNTQLTIQDMKDHSFLIQNTSVNLPKTLVSTNSVSYQGQNYDFSRIHPEYKSIHIVKVLKNSNASLIIQTAEKFCTNINDKHKNNHIYFIITNKMQMKQKCFCTCKHTNCKNFTSVSVPAPVKLYYTLLNHL